MLSSDFFCFFQSLSFIFSFCIESFLFCLFIGYYSRLLSKMYSSELFCFFQSLSTSFRIDFKSFLFGFLKGIYHCFLSRKYSGGFISGWFWFGNWLRSGFEKNNCMLSTMGCSRSTIMLWLEMILQFSNFLISFHIN